MCSQSWESLPEIKLQFKFKYEKKNTCETSLHYFFPKGRVVGGNWYRPYQSLPKMSLTKYRVAWITMILMIRSEKYHRILTPFLQGRSIFRHQRFFFCYYPQTILLMCIQQELPKPSNVSASRIIFLQSWIYDITQKLSISQTHIGRPTLAYTPDLSPVEIAFIQTTTENSDIW